MPFVSLYKGRPDLSILRVRVVPGASRNAVAGLHGDEIKFHLQSPPVDGAANAGLVAFVALLFEIKKNQVELIRGKSSRSKQLLVSLPMAEVRRRLAGLLESASKS